MHKPHVSVVIRTKNESKFIGKVLTLLEDQTYRDFEIIVVDSGSSDNTLQIVKKHNVMLYEIKPEEFGFSSTLNFGIEKAKGELIVILSGHTLPGSKKWLESGVENFKDDNVAGITGPPVELAFGYYLDVFRVFIYRILSNRSKKYHYTSMSNSNSMIRKSDWENYKFDERLDEEGCEDYDWACEMISRGRDVVLDFKFSSIHSHLWLGRSGFFARLPGWKKTREKIDKKKRPAI